MMRRIATVEEYLGRECVDSCIDAALQMAPEEKRGPVKRLLAGKLLPVDVEYEEDMQKSRVYEKIAIMYDCRAGVYMHCQHGKDDMTRAMMEIMHLWGTNPRSLQLSFFGIHAGVVERVAYDKTPLEGDVLKAHFELLGKGSEVQCNNDIALDVQCIPAHDEVGAIFVTSGAYRNHDDVSRWLIDRFARKTNRLGMILTCNGQHSYFGNKLNNHVDVYRADGGQNVSRLVVGYAKALFEGGEIPEGREK